ncbi:MAG: hypothetical protein FJ404_19670, partial [Verrucomicrobia bacterium]|nr:hypothetical protein [Verrucomicrobiota bacterium]
MLPVMQVGRVRPGAPPEHDVLHPVGGGLGQARPTNNIGIHGTASASAKSRCMKLCLGECFAITPMYSRIPVQTQALSSTAPQPRSTAPLLRAQHWPGGQGARAAGRSVSQKSITVASLLLCVLAASITAHAVT